MIQVLKQYESDKVTESTENFGEAINRRQLILVVTQLTKEQLLVRLV